MEDEGEYSGPELLEKLNDEWHKMAVNQPTVISFLQESMKKTLSDKNSGTPDIIAFFNQKLDINRFFIEDSDGKKASGANQAGLDMPKIESRGSDPGPSHGFNDNSDPFEDALEDALCVFKSGDTNSDIMERNEKLILFFVDLENESIINKNNFKSEEEKKQNKNEESDEQISEQKHPVLLNQYPICQNHSLILLFADAGLPQVLSDEIIILMLQIFKISDQPSLRIGYNSMGADCVANNLHFHLLYADQMFQNGEGNGEECFPIELARKKLFFITSLQHKKKEEINMYNCAVRFGELEDDWPLKTLVLSPEVNEETQQEDAQEALAHTAGIVLNYLIDQNIPHNILIADDGMTLYIIPRKFDLLIEKVSFFTSFETLCGFVKFKTESAYGQSNLKNVYDLMRNNVSLSDQDFERMKQELKDKFLAEYDGN